MASSLSNDFPLVSLNNPTWYDKEKTVRLTKQGKNQVVNNLSDHLSGVAGICTSLFNCLCCGYCNTVQVQPKYNVVVIQSGIVTNVLRQPGFYGFSSADLETRNVYMPGYIDNLADVPINDQHGYPCYVSATYTYKIIDPLAALFETPNYSAFVNKHAKIALQKGYAGPSKGRTHHENTIKSIFESLVSCVGIKIKTFRITAVKVDDNIQKLLLAQQEAQAYVNGKRTIAEGATSIVKLTMDNLKKKDIHLSKEDTDALVVNLTYAIVENENLAISHYQGISSSAQAMPFITLDQQRSNHHGESQETKQPSTDQ